MKRLIGIYGKVLLTSCIVAVVFGAFVVFGQRLEKNAAYEAKESADNFSENIRSLGERKKYPFFVGSRCITLNLGYKGKDGERGFSREDALELVEAYEYKVENQKEVLRKMEKECIKIYPFDDVTENLREFVDVNNTGKYTVKYVVEGETGLKTEMTMLVLVDILPEGMEMNESVGEKNESGS